MSLSKDKWISFLNELKELIYSAKESLPLENLFQDKELYEEISNVLNPDQIATWIMFDTAENQKSTEEIIKYMWADENKKEYLSLKYLEAIFSSYYSLYQVNNKTKKQLMIQNLLLKEHGICVDKNPEFVLNEGDLFLGRVIMGEEDNFIFQVVDKINMEKVETFLQYFFEIFNRHPIGSYNRDQLLNFFSEGYPELILMYSIAKKMTFDGIDDIYMIHNDEEWEDIDLDLKELDPFMKFAYEKMESEQDFERFYQQIFLINERFFPDEKERFWYKENNLDTILMLAAEEGLIASDEDLSLILHMIEKWIEKEAFSRGWADVVKFQNSIILYKNALSRSYKGFYSDPFLKKSVQEDFNEKSWHLWFFQGFEKFMDYIMVNTIRFTPSGRLKQEDLDEIVSYCNLSMFRTVKRPDERHYPILNLWKRFALTKNFLELQKKEVGIGESYDFYVRMSMEEKMALWITSLTNINFLQAIYQKESSLITSSGEVFYYDLKFFLGQVCKGPIVFKEIELEKQAFFFELFHALNLIVLKLGKFEHYEITKLGQRVASFLEIENVGKEEGPLIFPDIWTEK